MLRRLVVISAAAAASCAGAPGPDPRPLPGPAAAPRAACAHAGRGRARRDAAPDALRAGDLEAHARRHAGLAGLQRAGQAPLGTSGGGQDLKPRVTLELSALPGGVIARAESGELERFGQESESDRPFCRAGSRAFPFELCEDVAYRDHLVMDALLGGS